ncbi:MULTISPECIES: hypothetical protein [Clavibacter]|uniref:SPOR domain-containing protein n=2 Tax=Clavibacter TaxID=1573 RepID=A0A251YFA7_9MICO|nr:MULTISPECIES: hypothetical protein [Clavibacter]KZC94837.1 methionine aminopeptidase [Clavibacter michiganensis subsp. tessellarius]MBT1635947.1 SPOR domain-containing protein [Clavibacter michiganensis]MDA3805456.1 SPOR domain-containing protein [Clavibacter sp. CT19]OQJ63742.1 hypothetical protein B5P24_12425 [Clavibacter michiganensis subsp. tessellarius]OUE22932.1 hypothetical protein BFL36_08100 [Clavibacter michiganensis]
MSDSDEQYWYDDRTGEVEKGMLSPGVHRIGPFATAEEAAAAPQRLRERSEQWAAEERDAD